MRPHTHTHAHTVRWPLSVSMCPGFNCLTTLGRRALWSLFLSQPSTFTLSDMRERHNYPAKANVDAGLKGKHSREPTLLCASPFSIKGHIACLGSDLQDSLRFAMGTVRILQRRVCYVSKSVPFFSFAFYQINK